MKTRAVLGVDVPWLIPEVISWLECMIKPDWIILETGCGGSTVFFAMRTGFVISYEDRTDYERSVLAELKRRQIEKHVYLKAEPEYPKVGLKLGELPVFDLALIDGRGRVKSCSDAWPMIKPGGWLMLDDSSRPRYKQACVSLDEAALTKIVFSSGEIDHTTCWRKPL